MGSGVTPFSHNRAAWCSKIFVLKVHTIFSIDKRISVGNHHKQWHQANHDLQPALCAGKRVPVCPEYQSPIAVGLIPIQFTLVAQLKPAEICIQIHLR